jgi:DNA-binding winged helix-turn-helix (wHTH) protein
VRKIQFADFELDLELYLLQRGDVRVEIGSRALDLLIYLIEHRQRVVELDELREEVWKAVALSQSSIPTCVRELRIALGDDASKPALIGTSRGRGYRFIGRVSGLRVDEERSRRYVSTLPFVGRTSELERLRHLAAEANKTNRLRLVVVRGEAGIGKTRFVTEFISDGIENAKIYLAASPEVDSVPSFWPWTQIVRDALIEDASEESNLYFHARKLSTIFPEVLQDADLRTSRPAPLDPHLILSQWAQTIRSVSTRHPIVLILEDIHRTDQDTLTLLSWICGELAAEPILVVVTHRPLVTDARTKTAAQIASLSVLSNSETIDLTHLEDYEISQMLDPLIENRDEAGVVLKQRTAGNAFYVTHMIRHYSYSLIASSPEKLADTLPPDAQDIVVAQLSDLSPSSRLALSVASISGIRFSIESISEILGISSPQLLDDLEEARRGWFLVEDGAQFRFAHSLLRDALYESLDSHTRRQLHLDFAHSLARREQGQLRAAQIAEHLIASYPLGDAREVWEWSAAAAKESVSRLDYAAAQSFFESALKIDEEGSAATPAERCKLLLDFSASRHYAGDRPRCRQLISEAADIARLRDLPIQLAECALQLAPDFLSIEFGVSDAVLIHRLEEATAALPKEHTSLIAKLHASLSQALKWTDDFARCESLAIAALRLARECEDQSANAAALSARAETLHGPENLKERLQTLVSLGIAQRTTSSISQTLVQKTRLISALLELGELAQLDAENEACRQLAAETKLPQLLWYPESMDVMRQMMTGKKATDLDRLSKRHAEIAELGGDVNIAQGFATQQLFAMIERNELNEALKMIEPISAAYPAVRSWSAGLAWVQYLAGREADARSTLARFEGVELTALFREVGGGVGIATIAEVAAGLGAKRQTAAIYERLKPVAQCHAAAGYGVLYMGCYARYLGLMATSMGRTEVAVRYLRSAVQREEAVGALPWKAYSQVDLAAVLHSENPVNPEIQVLVNAAKETSLLVGSARLDARLKAIAEEIQEAP